MSRSPRYHAAHYHPSNIVFAAAGNLQSRRGARAGATRGSRRATAPGPSEPRPALRADRADRRDDPPDRAGPPRVRRARAARARPRPVRVHRAEPGVRRRHVVTSVPVGPRGARPRVLRLLVPRRVRGHADSSRSTRAPRPIVCTRRSASSTASSTASSATASRRPSSTRRRATSPGSLAMSLETSSSRMRRIGRSEQVEGEVPSLDELVARVTAVTADDVERVIDRVLREAPPNARSGRPARGRRLRRLRSALTRPRPVP